MLTHVDLFSGIGGFSLACEWAGVETIAFAEIDPYASRVLQRHWPNVRNYGDVRAFPSLSAWLLTAGVPCQPASIAGKRKGAADDRWLWPETLAVVENGSYEWLLFENPTGILSLNDGLEFERVCSALEGQGYEVQPLVVPAAAVNAKHRRERCWVLGHTKRSERWSITKGRHVGNGNNTRRQKAAGRSTTSGKNGIQGAVANPVSEQLRTSGHGRLAGTSGAIEARKQQREWVWLNARQRGQEFRDATIEGLPNWAGGEMGQPCPLTEFERPGGREIERDFRGVAHGVSRRVDRLRTLGNAIVPQVAYQLIKRMIEADVLNVPTWDSVES